MEHKRRYKKSLFKSRRQSIRDVNKYLKSKQGVNSTDNTVTQLTSLDVANQTASSSEMQPNLSQAYDFIREEQSENLSWSINTTTDSSDLLETTNILNDKENISSENMSVSKALKIWAIKFNITQNALRELLIIMSKTCNITEIPLDPRTLLKSENLSLQTCIDDINGDYIYIGLEENIKKSISLGKLKVARKGSQYVQPVSLSINIDGMQVFRSTNHQLWPILCAVNELDNPKPFAVSLFLGKSKPSPVNTYLEPFAKELLYLTKNCITINNRKYIVDIKKCFFVCDAPAKAFIKCIKLHSGYYSCDRCCQKGKWLGKVTFPKLSAELRTDTSFRNKIQAEHHISASPLEILPIDMIAQFPIDYMHLVCLGITRRLLINWFRGNKHIRHSAVTKQIISDKLSSISKYIPSEFSRLPRRLEELDRWKATEYRQFLLYTGPIVLKKVLRKECYENFIHLSIAMRLLLSEPEDERNVENCRRHIQTFITKCKVLYGPEFLVYNVHCLYHLCDDVNRFGSPELFSAFKFENYLGLLKTKIRARGHVVRQLINRLNEMSYIHQPEQNSENTLKTIHYAGPTFGIRGTQFKKYFFSKYGKLLRFDISERNSCVLLCNGDVAVIRNIIQQNDGSVFIINNVYKEYNNIFSKPVQSSSILLYVVSNLSEIRINSIDDIYCKCMKVILDNKIFIVPMIK